MKEMKKIGNCDTCDYVFQCDRCSTTGVSLLKSLFGCPQRLIEQWQNQKKDEKNN